MVPETKAQGQSPSSRKPSWTSILEIHLSLHPILCCPHSLGLLITEPLLESLTCEKLLLFGTLEAPASPFRVRPGESVCDACGFPSFFVLPFCRVDFLHSATTDTVRILRFDTNVLGLSKHPDQWSLATLPRVLPIRVRAPVPAFTALFYPRAVACWRAPVPAFTTMFYPRAVACWPAYPASLLDQDCKHLSGARHWTLGKIGLQT